jgi:hypothetical protein
VDDIGTHLIPVVESVPAASSYPYNFARKTGITYWAIRQAGWGAQLDDQGLDLWIFEGREAEKRRQGSRPRLGPEIARAHDPSPAGTRAGMLDGRNHGMLGVAGFGASVWHGEHTLHLHALGVLPIQLDTPDIRCLKGPIKSIYGVGCSWPSVLALCPLNYGHPVRGLVAAVIQQRRLGRASLAGIVLRFSRQRTPAEGGRN